MHVEDPPPALRQKRPELSKRFDGWSSSVAKIPTNATRRSGVAADLGDSAVPRATRTFAVIPPAREPAVGGDRRDRRRADPARRARRNAHPLTTAGWRPSIRCSSPGAGARRRGRERGREGGRPGVSPTTLQRRPGREAQLAHIARETAAPRAAHEIPACRRRGELDDARARRLDDVRSPAATPPSHFPLSIVRVPSPQPRRASPARAGDILLELRLTGEDMGEHAQEVVPERKPA